MLQKKYLLVIRFIIFVLIYSFFTCKGYCQSDELKSYFTQTKKSYNKKDYKKAAIFADKAINLSIEEFGMTHLTTATLLENKGRILLELQNYAEAEVQFIKVVDIRKNLIKDHDPEMAEALNYLAVSLRKQNKLSEALKIHDKVLSIMSNIIANNPGQISELSRRSALYRARAYQTKGELLIENGNYVEAEGNFRIASKIFERTLGKNKKELLELLENYLKVLELRGDEKEAVLIAKRIKEINQY